MMSLHPLLPTASLSSSGLFLAFGLCLEGGATKPHTAMSLPLPFSYSALPRGRYTVTAAYSGDASSQFALGYLHYMSALRLDILQGTPADDQVVTARWAEALRLLGMAALQGDENARAFYGHLFAAGRNVSQNWTTAVKWWREAAEAGRFDAQWYMGLCYYYGRGGLDRDAEQAKVWFRKAAAQGWIAAAETLEARGIPGQPVRQVCVRFKNAASTPARHAIARQLADKIEEEDDSYLRSELQNMNALLRCESDVAVLPHPSPRDNVWVYFMMRYGVSEEDLAGAVQVELV